MENGLVDQFMSTDLVTTTRDATAAAAAARMREADVGSILVVDEAGRLEGLLTAVDFVELVRTNDPHDETLVGECMTTDVVTVSPTDAVDEVPALEPGRFTHFPVTDADGTVVGMLSTTDLTEHVARPR